MQAKCLFLCVCVCVLEPSVFFTKSVYAVEESVGVMEVQVCRRGCDLSHPTTATLTTQPPSAQGTSSSNIID